MATYNADIRIGVVGKSSLNQLEAQLNRVNKQIKGLQSSLKLRGLSQRINLDTRAAMTSVRQLEERIKRLGRTVRVNLETSGSSKTDKGGAALIQNPQQTQAATAAVAAYGTQVAKVAKQSSELTEALSKQATVSDKLNAKVKAIAQNKRDLTQAQNGFAMKGKSVKQSLSSSQAALEANVNWLRIYQGQLRAAGAEVLALQQAETAAANAAAAALDKKTQLLSGPKTSAGVCKPAP